MAVCRLCGAETEGSYGAAGLFWPAICQRCKDQEDAIIASEITTLAWGINHVYDEDFEDEE